MKHQEIHKTVTDNTKDEPVREMVIHTWTVWDPDTNFKMVCSVSAPESSDLSEHCQQFPALLRQLQNPNQESLPLAPDQPTASKKASSKKAPTQVPVDDFCDTGVLLALQKAGILYIDQVCGMDKTVIKTKTGLTMAAVEELGTASKKGAKPKKEPAKAKVA
jgi:hypothetical protein